NLSKFTASPFATRAPYSTPGLAEGISDCAKTTTANKRTAIVDINFFMILLLRLKFVCISNSENLRFHIICTDNSHTITYNFLFDLHGIEQVYTVEKYFSFSMLNCLLNP